MAYFHINRCKTSSLSVVSFIRVVFTLIKFIILRYYRVCLKKLQARPWTGTFLLFSSLFLQKISFLDVLMLVPCLSGHIPFITLLSFNILLSRGSSSSCPLVLYTVSACTCSQNHEQVPVFHTYSATKCKKQFFLLIFSNNIMHVGMIWCIHALVLQLILKNDC